MTIFIVGDQRHEPLQATYVDEFGVLQSEQ